MMWFISFAFLFIAFPKAVFSYLDPSAGSYIMQFIFAMLFSLLFFMRAFWQKIRSLFTRLLNFLKHSLSGGTMPCLLTTINIMLFLGLLLLIPKTASAYLDPGTIGYFIQLLVAAIAGIGFAVKIFWHRVNKGDYSDVSDIKKLNLVGEELYNKIEPYLTVK